MEPLTGLFIAGLYKATEKIWENGFDAAWAPVGEALKERFTRLAGRDQESQRRTAFARAAERARGITLRYAADLKQAARILDALNGERERRGAEALAEEAAKLMLFSAVPDVPRLTNLCHRSLRFEALFAKETPPPVEMVATVLGDFLTNLREAMLDEEPYHDLIQREMLRALREVVAELRPREYDTEDTYCVQLAEMYRQLEFMGIPELKERRPITVEDIFIRLRSEREAEPEAERESLEAYRLAEERGDLEALARLREARTTLVHAPAPRVRVAIEEALRETKRMVVLGDPGAGKTTLLKYLTVICAERRSESELGLKADGAGAPLPIFVPLREFAAECTEREEDYCLLDYLFTHSREHLMLNLPPDFFEDALDAGRCLVCLDGLDEVWVVGQRKAVRDAVKALATRFPRSCYVVTSRKVGYEEAPLDRRDFAHRTILPFEDEDIRTFVHKWYEARERDPVQRKQKTNDLIATIEREPRIKALAENPLLLTIIALVHRIEAELPHERVKLYDKCVTALVDTWEEVKGLTIEEKQRPFYRYRPRLLERLAYELHIRAEEPGQLQTMKAGDLELLLARFLMENRRLGLSGDPDGARDEARAFVRLARGRTGLLVERGEGVFGFPHLTFQEYLAACDIEKRCMPYGVNAIWEEIKDHLHDPHWREVILLLLGSLNRYEDAPTLLVERILEAGERDKFEPVLHRYLYLAARALADKVDIANELHRGVVDQLLTVARKAPSWERDDALAALSWLEGDNYAGNGLLALACDAKVDDRMRSEAASALGKLGRTEEATEILLALARDAKVYDVVSREAASALGKLGRVEEATGILLSLACDAQVIDWVRREAASALGELGRAKDEVLDGLLALARDAKVSDEVRSEAASALGELGRAEEATEILLALARDAKVDDEVRSEAASALGKLGRTEEATEILLALASDPQVTDGVRSAAASALGELGRTEEATEILLALACDAKVDDAVRSAAASALGELGRAEEATEILLALAHDAKVDDWVRSKAASALGELGRAEEATEILLALAHDAKVDDWVRSRAASVLGKLGRAEDEVLDGLLALARGAKVADRVRSAAASALGELGRAEEATEILLALARDPQVDDWARHEAASALGELGRTDEATEILLALACDAKVNDWVRSEAASALGELGRTEEATEILLALARDAKVYEWATREAAYVLGKLGRTEEATEILLAVAHNPQMADWVRSEAVYTLGNLGRTEDKVLDDLLALACDAKVDDGVRSAAAYTLGNLGRTEDKVLDGLLALACDAKVDDRVRSAAAYALGKLGRTEDKVLDGLLALACDAKVDDEVRSAAASALGNLDRAEDKVLDGLLALARDAKVDDTVRSAAASALGKLGRAEEATEILLALACDVKVDDGVRREAASALGNLGRTEEATKILLALARDAKVDDRVRSEAASALGELGRAEDKVLDGLLVLACDAKVDDGVRREAASALGQLGSTEDKVLDGLLAMACDAVVADWARYEAASALGKLGRAEDKVLDGLLALASNKKEDFQVRRGAYEGLKRLVGGATD